MGVWTDVGGRSGEDSSVARRCPIRGRQIARANATVAAPPYITRKVPVYELASEELLALVEENTEIVLEEIGIDFRDDPRALQLFEGEGALVEEERVRFPRGMCREIIRKHAPNEFTQHARNPDRSVQIGGDHAVFVPAYGPPNWEERPDSSFEKIWGSLYAGRLLADDIEEIARDLAAPEMVGIGCAEAASLPDPVLLGGHDPEISGPREESSCTIWM